MEGAGFGRPCTLPGINDSLGSGCSAEHISPAGRERAEVSGLGSSEESRPDIPCCSSLLLRIGQLGSGSLSYEGFFFFFPFCSGQKDLVSPSGGGSQTRAEFIQLQQLCHEVQRWNALFTYL